MAVVSPQVLISEPQMHCINYFMKLVTVGLCVTHLKGYLFLEPCLALQKP